MKTNLIVTFLALTPLFGYVVLSSCAPQQASYGPIKRDATGIRQYSNTTTPKTIEDSIRAEHARYLVNTILPCTCDLDVSSYKNHN